jgi:hypothetical protein
LLFFGAVAVSLAALHYYDYFNITDWHHFFDALFNTVLGSSHSSIGINNNVLFNVSVFKKNLYLDAGLSQKHDVAKTEDLVWLNKFGTIGTFLKMILNHQEKQAF